MSGRPMITPPAPTAARETATTTEGRPRREGGDWSDPGQPNKPGSVDTRSVTASFADATNGYAAVPVLRAAGFPIDLAVTVDGDLVVTIQVARARLDEVHAVLAAHVGRTTGMPAPDQPSA